MRQMRLHYPASLISRILKVSASGFYVWRDRPLSKWAHEEARLEVEIRAAHKRTRQTYGAERLQQDLAEHGIQQVGICRIKRIRRKLGIHCKQKRKFKATTDSYAVSRRGNSRQPLTPSINCRWRRTYLSSNLRCMSRMLRG